MTSLKVCYLYKQESSQGNFVGEQSVFLNPKLLEVGASASVLLLPIFHLLGIFAVNFVFVFTVNSSLSETHSHSRINIKKNLVGR